MNKSFSALINNEQKRPQTRTAASKLSVVTKLKDQTSKLLTQRRTVTHQEYYQNGGSSTAKACKHLRSYYKDRLNQRKPSFEV